MFYKIITFLPVRAFHYFLSLPWIRYSFIGALYHNSLSPRDKMLYTAMHYARVSKLAGDYFEFGVYEGANMVAAFHISKRYLPNLHFYAFDSFEGLPEPKEDTGEFRPFEKGQFSCSKDQFLKNLRKKGVDMSRVHTIAGWYKDTLNEKTRASLPAKSAAIVYVDCDLYEFASSVLDFIVPYLEDGTLILFDEWYGYRGDPNKGEQRAFREWTACHPEISVSSYHKFGWSGNSFIVHIKR